MIICDYPQGSDSWLRARLGVITASKAHALLLSKNSKTPKYKEARATYMMELIAEVCTGNYEELNAKQLEWGKVNEEAAISCFEFSVSKKVEKVGLAYKDESKRAGASADFKVINENIGGENKCPFNTCTHLEFILNDQIKDEYLTQMQFGLWVTGWDAWFFHSYDPRMKRKVSHYKVIEKDMELMSYFDYEVPKFIKEMDDKLKILDINFGDHWTHEE